ncbi:MAG: hypothetical protein WA990_04930 [Rubrobacteraceae bacterium]
MRIEPAPTPEETAAIMAALEIMNEDEKGAPSVKRSRWRLAGLLGHPVPPGMNLEGLWSFRGWEGQA